MIGKTSYTRTTGATEREYLAQIIRERGKRLLLTSPEKKRKKRDKLFKENNLPVKRTERDAACLELLI